tara:strand:+ start:145 stop:762 length:618 start_codon:yes stop_codon:yes gene_type:complete
MKTIFEIFPQLIYKENLKIKDINLKDFPFVQKTPHTIKVSKSNKILEIPALKFLKGKIQDHINIFTKDILEISKDLDFYITRSWIITVDNEHFDFTSHNHQNSFFTGILYLDLDEGSDCIHFHKERGYQYVGYDYENINKYNQQSLTFHPNKNDLIIFDARLHHTAGNHITKNIRTSLAFEVFAKGSFGKENTFNNYNKGELILK